jgi:hypothetical protein
VSVEQALKPQATARAKTAPSILVFIDFLP